MTRYTIRDATTLASLAVHNDLRGAVDALETEELAWRLNPPAGTDTLQLVVTVDDEQDRTDEADLAEEADEANSVGDVVVHYAAGGGPAATAVVTGQ